MKCVDENQPLLISREQSERSWLRRKGVTSIFGYIEELTCCEVIEDLEIMRLSGVQRIRILIGSHGGVVDSGMGIIREIERIRSEGIEVIGEVHGSAMSMAFLVLQSCSKRIMGKGDILMHHGVTSFSVGDIRDINSEKKLLTFWQGYIAEMLSKRVSVESSIYKNKEIWIKDLSDSTPQYWTSEEAFREGLIDEVV